MLALAFPPLDPVLVSFGPLSIRWYALAYLAGFLGGWRYCFLLARQNPKGPTPAQYDEFLTWAIIGTILGGRIGYVLFYQLSFYIENPAEAFQVWHGGMAFHGGMLGVILAAFFYVRRAKLSFFGFTDLLACATPIGLGLGRLANFVNGELYGRVTDVSWAVIFPRGGDLPRHPSQIYESALEGFALFIILALLSQSKWVRARNGFISGMFLLGYGAFRFFVEFFREPDPQLGFLFAGATMGQLLCVPMILFGIFLVVRAVRRPAAA